jgi:hypothetical protein
MAWNDLATTVSRVAKGSVMDFSEYDNNINNLNAKQATKVPYHLDDSDNIIGYLGAADAIYPLVTRPIEVLAGSAVASSCVSSAVDEELYTLNILAGTLGVNSVLQIEPLWTFTSSANNKICKVIIGGTTVYTSGNRTTSVKEAPLIVLANRNALNSQIMPYDNNYVTAGSGTPATYAIDFSVNQTLQIIGQRANSGDALTLEYFRVLHFVGD